MGGLMRFILFYTDEDEQDNRLVGDLVPCIAGIAIPRRCIVGVTEVDEEDD